MYALLTTAFWGVWGAFAGLPTQHGFPETLVYLVWALTMIPPALYAWRRVGWWRAAHGKCRRSLVRREGKKLLRWAKARSALLNLSGDYLSN
jgi:hypothetical protein